MNNPEQISADDNACIVMTRKTQLKSGDYLTIWIEDGRAAYFRPGENLRLANGDSKMLLDGVSNDVDKIIERASQIGRADGLRAKRIQCNLNDRVMFKFSSLSAH